MPMIHEAVFCVMEGVATPEAVDPVMKLGMNHPLGPLALADLIGLDVCLAILEVLHRDLGDDKYRPAPLLRKLVAAGRLGRKSGRGFYGYRDLASRPVRDATPDRRAGPRGGAGPGRAVRGRVGAHPPPRPRRPR